MRPTTGFFIIAGSVILAILFIYAMFFLYRLSQHGRRTDRERDIDIDNKM